MRRATFAKHVRTDEVEAAIRRAEEHTSGEIRVSIAPFFWGDVEKTARRAFARLGMDRTRDQNGVLLFVVPSRHRLFVLGDVGISRLVPPGFWDQLAHDISDRFRAGDATKGLVEAIQRVGAVLAEHFPKDEGDENELPEGIDWGPSPPPSP
jgi:uncharacterized membrane protein